MIEMMTEFFHIAGMSIPATERLKSSVRTARPCAPRWRRCSTVSPSGPWAVAAQGHVNNKMREQHFHILNQITRQSLWDDITHLTLYDLGERIIKVQFGQNLILIRRDHGKISYERRVYESVDDKSLSYDISRKFLKKNNSGHKVLTEELVFSPDNFKILTTIFIISFQLILQFLISIVVNYGQRKIDLSMPRRRF